MAEADQPLRSPSGPAAPAFSAVAAAVFEPVDTRTPAADVAVLEALELPLNGPRRFWLGFVFTDAAVVAVRARRLAEDVVRGRRMELEIHAAVDAAAVEPVARRIVGHDRTESPLWVDWSALGSSPRDRAAVDRALALMNAARTRMTRALCGGLVIVAPSWAETPCAQGAVDLWSGREFALRLRPDPPSIETRRDAVGSPPYGAQSWRRLAPIEVMRVLREDGAPAALRRAEALAAAAPPQEAQRLATVAAGVALESGDREAAGTRARAVIESGAAAPDVLAAAAEVGAAGATNPVQAAELWRRAVDTMRRLLGEEHPDTLRSMNNLAETLRAQGDLVGARELYERVLVALGRVLGEEHPDTLRSMNNLAATLGAQGDLVGARELHERVLVASRRVLGEEHPDTLWSMNNLAVTLAAQGDLVGARELLKRVLEARRRVLGEEHPDTLTATSNLAKTLPTQRPFTETDND